MTNSFAEDVFSSGILVRSVGEISFHAEKGSTTMLGAAE
jgi:hypothetical protein